ncbi:hypothetical protein AB0I53_19260 [Saccharopolyspora sp. NPDC050389]
MRNGGGVGCTTTERSCWVVARRGAKNLQRRQLLRGAEIQCPYVVLG